MAIALVLFLAINVGLHNLLIPLPANTPAESAPSAETVSNPTAVPAEAVANVPVEPTTGSWVRADGIVTQQSTLSQDMLYPTGLIAENFTVNMRITLPSDVADAGGGLLFHMANRDLLVDAQMVRLADGGKTIMWGYYDSSGAFIGEGGTTINLPAPYDLSIVVQPASYAIFVNGTLLAENLPLTFSGGYLAYLSFSGPTSFSDFNLILAS
jgi:hypothetical protein